MLIEPLEIIILINNCKKFLQDHGTNIKISNDMNEIEYVSIESAAKCMAKALIAMRKASVSNDTIVNEVKAFDYSLNNL